MPGSVEEDNRKQTETLGMFIQEVEDARALLEKCDYVIYTKKEFEKRRSQLGFYIILLFLSSVGLGFWLCRVFVKT